MNKIKHNGKISFWKFMFSLMIVALHLGFLNTTVEYRFSAGSIAVDFFFLVSGYLFCKKCLNIKSDIKEIGRETFDFIINKIKRFLPYIVFLWIISIPFSVFVNKYNLLDFEKAFFNLLYFPIHNNPVYNIYGITWYISAMLIVEFILYPLLIKYKQNFVYIVSPIIVYIVGGYLFIKYGNISSPWSIDLFCYKGLLRAFCGINLGMFLYVISSKLSNIKFTDFSKFSLTIIEILGYLSIFLLVNKVDAHNRFDPLMIIIFSICILISFSEKAYLNDFFNNKFFYYLEKLSLPIYINQWLLIEFVEYMKIKFNFQISYYYELAVIIILLIVLGITELKFLDYIKSKWPKIKTIFIDKKNI